MEYKSASREVKVAIFQKFSLTLELVLAGILLNISELNDLKKHFHSELFKALIPVSLLYS